MNKSITIVKREHPGWVEMKESAPTLRRVFEQYQYLYSKGGVTISLIQFVKGMYDPHNWEIYQLKGKPQVFSDVERFKSKKEAERRIRELLVDE